MNEHDLLRRVTAAKTEFGTKCKKYAGAVTTEILREVLQWHGIQTSSRDVFIAGVPVEIDLLVPKVGAVPQEGILYRAEDVLLAFEVKKSGAFGEGTITNTKQAFESIRSSNPRIRCAYVTLSEQRGYKWKATEENLGAAVYTFFWFQSSPETNRRYDASGDFEKLLQGLQAIIAAQS